MELLILLVERRGELVSRDEIAERLWGKDVFLDIEHGINTAVRKVRRALRDDSDKPRFIETVIGRGYRFAAPVTCNTDGGGKRSAPVEAEEAIQGEPPKISASEGTALAVAPQKVDSKRKWLPIAGVSLLFFAVAIGFSVFEHRNAKLPSAPPIKSLAVLPLKNLSGDPQQEYLVDGMTEALIGRLSAIHDLRVISRTSAMHFKDTPLSVPEIAKALQVDALVEGSVMRQGNRVRVIAQLIRGTDEHFWSETYDRDLPDVLALQSDVAQAIAQRVEATLTRKEEQRITRSHTVSPEAYESYLKGQFLLHNKGRTRAGLEESIRYFEQTLRADPAFARGYVGLAAAHSDLGAVLIGGRPDEERAQVVSAARKALQLDPNLAEAHDLLAYTALKHWQWADAENEFRLAIELNPNDSEAYMGLAQWLLAHGRFDEALTYSGHARTLDSYGSTSWGHAWVLFQARRYDDAIRELRSTLAVHPDDMGLSWILGFAFLMKGQPKDAIPILERTVALSGRTSGTLDLLAAAYARAGRRSDALRLLAELKLRQRKGYVPAASFIISYISLGENEQAFAWLEKGYQEQSAIMQWIKVHPLFDPLRDDPRFADLVRRVGLN